MNRFVEQVKEFQEKFGHPVRTTPADIDSLDWPDLRRLLGFRFNLIQEEVNELDEATDEMLEYQGEPGCEELYKDSKREALDALADILVVTIGTALAMGFDIEEAMERVHASNMSKLGENGKPIYRGDGKILKGPDYFPPRLDDLV